MNDSRNESPKAPKKYYSLEEANKALPLVRSIVGDIVALFAEVKERQERLLLLGHDSESKASENDLYAEELAEIEKGLEADIDKLQGYVTELESLGVQLKDPRTGLIDFYTRMEGRDVFLCWKLGEGEIAHWHELDAGFSGRQSLFEQTFSGDSGFNSDPTFSLD